MLRLVEIDSVVGILGGFGIASSEEDFVGLLGLRDEMLDCLESLRWRVSSSPSLFFPPLFLLSYFSILFFSGGTCY